MLPPASKKVATGGPAGSNGNGAVEGSSETPPRPPPAPTPSVGCPPGIPPRAPGRPGAAGAGRCAGRTTGHRPAPRPRPRAGPLLARIHTPVKSIFPSAVRRRRRVVVDPALRGARNRRIAEFRPLGGHRHGRGYDDAAMTRRAALFMSVRCEYDAGAAAITAGLGCRPPRMRTMFSLVLLFGLIVAGVEAQWPKSSRQDVPRKADGGINLDAPAPRMPDGRLRISPASG